ncbi:MAG: hypothetical protein B6I31_00225 [Desulfobacteraceae bacterium 4572_19]|nr:MAG: hypothetical protein B6I31_00225 [Desulfobacteraceae bacterium 4572_19]
MKKKTEKGFTLLEVLIALTIIGISLGVIFQSLARSKRISWKADEVMEAARISNNLLADSVLLEQVVKDKDMDGTVEDDDKWSYTISAKPLEIEVFEDDENSVEIASMYEINLCLILKSHSKEKSFCLARWYRE